MTSKLVWTERAISALEEIDSYIAADDSIAAEHWVEGLLEAAQRAAEMPPLGASRARTRA